LTAIISSSSLVELAESSVPAKSIDIMMCFRNRIAN
jgi:hypothetical protein